jgi:HD-GYP domain-containing protein (c-di-GMP phosphodiesterase class II)
MAPPNKALSPKIQQTGKRMVMQLHMVLRTIRIHDPTNNALLVATENLKDTINTLWAALGGVRLQFVDDVVYLNDVRLRMDTSMLDNASWLRSEFMARGLGGLAFSRPVDTAALREFLVILGKPVESEDEGLAIRASLAQMKELALELLGPKTFADGKTVDEIRIDRKTFALQTYAKAVVAARECLTAIREGRDPMGGRLAITRVIQDLVDIATERVNLLLKMCAIKQADEYAFSHAANTCLVSIAIGKAMQIDRLQLADLGSSAFLADLGFALLPPELIERREKLDDHARSEILDAMTRTIRSLVGSGRLNDAVMRRAIIAYEHHLPYLDPKTGAPAELHLFSRIVAVADAYDALTTNRPWRSGYSPDEALRILSSEAGKKFDPLVVKVLVNLMGLYPLGTAVRLDTGEIAIVYHNSNDPQLFEKPWVKVVRDAAGQRVKRTVIRNLALHEGAGGQIVGTASANELTGIDPGMAIVL